MPLGWLLGKGTLASEVRWRPSGLEQDCDDDTGSRPCDCDENQQKGDDQSLSAVQAPKRR